MDKQIFIHNTGRAALLLLLMLLTTAQTAWAQSDEKQMCVIVHETEQTTAFALEARPVVSFTETDVKLECNDITVLYPLDHYLKLTIGESETTTTGIEPTVNGQSARFNITESTITVTGCSSLSVYTVDGKIIAAESAATDDVITLNISQLRTGTYVAVFGNQSFKFNKKK
jgi:hypothetical protein